MEPQSDTFGVSLTGETASYHVTREMSPYSDRLALMFGTFSDMLLAAGFKSDPRYESMVDHWNDMKRADFEAGLEDGFPWDELPPETTCGSGDHAAVDTVYPKPDDNGAHTPNVTGGFLAGDIVKVTSDAYVDSGRVLNMVGRVARFSEEYARLNRQSVLVHFKEHSDMLFWLDPRALTLIYRA